MKTVELSPMQMLAVQLGFPVFIYEETMLKLNYGTYYAIKRKNGSWFTGTILSCSKVTDNLYKIEWGVPTSFEVLCMQLLLSKPFPSSRSAIDPAKITETIRVIGSTPLEGWIVVGSETVHKTKELAEQEMRRLIEKGPNKKFVVAKLESSAKMEVYEPQPQQETKPDVRQTTNSMRDKLNTTSYPSGTQDDKRGSRQASNVDQVPERHESLQSETTSLETGKVQEKPCWICGRFHKIV